MSKQVEVPEEAVRDVERWQTEVAYPQSAEYLSRLLAVALPAIYKHFNDRLLSDEALEGICSEIPGLSPSIAEDVQDLRRGLEKVLPALQATSIPTTSDEEG